MVKPLEYLTYRGREGQWAWMLHRATGLGGESRVRAGSVGRDERRGR